MLRNLFLASVILIATSLQAVEKELRFDKNELNLVNLGEFTRVRFKNAEIIGKPGEPELPALSITILLPPFEKAAKVFYEIISKEEIPGNYKLYPIQPPAILPIPGLRLPLPQFYPPKKEIYDSDCVYPREIVKIGSTGFMREYGLCGLIVHPVIYRPSSGKLELITRLKIKIVTSQAQITLPKRESKKTKELAQNFISKLVSNPEFVQAYAELIPTETIGYDYLIITSNQFYRELGPFQFLIRESGLKDTVVTTNLINTVSTGRDLAEKMRNFARHMYEEYGIYYLLLCGDVESVPSRIAFAMDCEAGFFRDENDIHTDYYFSCLNGSWNYNENDTFGEVGDSVDLYPELLVGRIPASTRQNITTFVNKNRIYRNSPPTNYITKSLFASEILWWEPYTDSGIGKNLLLQVFPLHFEIERLYQSLGNENLETVVASLNAGKGIFNHYGHGFISVMGVGNNEFLDTYTASTLSNNGRLGIGYSIGCWVAAFDYSNCVAEELVNNPDGGTIAFVGNNRYGWGSPGNPGYGYSERYDYCYFEAIFTKGIKQIGDALAFCKAYFAPLSGEANLFRWHEYQLNLLGDPSLIIWTNEPATLTANKPDTIITTTTSVTVIVKNEAGDPVENADAVLIQSGLMVGKAKTEINGIARINVTLPLSAGYAMLICTKEDYKKLIDTIYVVERGASIRVSRYGFICEDSIIREDQVPAGSTDTLFFTILNDGTVNIDSGTVILVPAYPISAAPRIFNFSALAPTESISFRSTVNMPSHLRTPSRINLLIQTPFISRDEIISINPIYPDLKPKHYIIYGANNYLMPGETSRIRFLFKNEGGYKSSDCEVIVRALRPNVIFPVESFFLGPANPGETITHNPIDIYVTIEAEVGSFVPVEFTVSFADGRRSVDTLNLIVGRYVFFDDAENEGELEHSGTPDLWARTEIRSHSGRFSYGYTGPDGYPPNANGKLITPSIVLHPDACLSFWVYYDVATYGNDGLYIKVAHERGDTSTLDYLGSGGALTGRLGFSVGWSEMKYSLLGRQGERIKIIFEVTTDSDGNGSGFFVDDIMVYIPHDNATAIEEEKESEDEIVIYPNPANSVFTVEYEINGPKTLEIFDILGKMVDKVRLTEKKGKLKIGDDLSSGVYLLKLTGSNKQVIKKCIILR